MTLQSESVNWAIEFVARHSDGDLFPRLLELGLLQQSPADLAKLLSDQDLTKFPPGQHRRFIVPKDDISYRTATQLHPQDSVLLTAIVYQFGSGIERRRRTATEVYSYRFAPDIQHGLYGSGSRWNEFWTAARQLGATCPAVLYCDIADFYNQIYHHTVENQLIESGFSNQATKWIVRLLESTTAGVSRGVPIGPHAIHLIAEASMIPIDNSFAASGLRVLRYADDMVFFCESEKAARAALGPISNTLDKQQRLLLQRHKTKIMRSAEFQAYCGTMVEDRPISSDEDQVLQVIKKYTGGDPYETISYNDISADDWAKLDEKTIRQIIVEYLSAPEVDYIRLRWFYRRLTQVGHPGALDVSLEHLGELGPCFGNMCAYFGSAQTIDGARWRMLGGQVMDLLNMEEVRDSPYFRLSLLSLFTRNEHMNHFARLAGGFESSDPDARREILLAAWRHGATDWIREKKEDFNRMDPWQKIAFLFCCTKLAPDERKYLMNHLSLERPFEFALASIVKRATPP